MIDVIRQECKGWVAIVPYPSVDNANPYVMYTMHGPDDQGHGLNWGIGHNERDRVRSGMNISISAFLNNIGMVKKVEWQKN